MLVNNRAEIINAWRRRRFRSCAVYLRPIVLFIGSVYEVRPHFAVPQTQETYVWIFPN